MSTSLPERLLGDSFRFTPGEKLADTVYRLGAVQMDPVQVVAPAHLWTLSLRRGPTTNRDLAAALRRGEILEAYTHARCLVAACDGPALVRQWRTRRRRNAARAHGIEREYREVLERLELGPDLAARELVSDRRVQGGWDLEDQRTAKPTTVALDVLWFEGRIVVSDRGPEGKRYDLLARRYPELDALLAHATDEEALRASLAHTARSWKVYRPAWAAPGFGRGEAGERRRWQEWLVESGEVSRESHGDHDDVFVHHSLPEDVREPSGARLLAPLDNVLWSRSRLESLFQFYYRWEVYTPEALRKVGPYNMPVLVGGRFWGQADARTADGRLRLRWHPEEGRRVPEEVRRAGRDAVKLARAIRPGAASARSGSSASPRDTGEAARRRCLPREGGLDLPEGPGPSGSRFPEAR